MVFPSSKGTEGWIHVPHIFYEVYWNPALFANMRMQGKGSQPFILANGDRTGYSLHGDFVSYHDRPSITLWTLQLNFSI